MRLGVLFREDDVFRVGFHSSEDTFQVGFGSFQTVTVDNNYEILVNKPSINGVELIGNKTSEDLGIGSGDADFPEEGNIGDVLIKTGSEKGAVSWVTPASNAEEDNTRPITAAAVYTEIGNINALLATI